MIGTVIPDFNFTNVVEDHTINELTYLLFKNHILIFKTSGISLEAFVKFSQLFGSLDPCWDINNVHPNDPRIMVVKSPRAHHAAGISTSECWHTDRSFTLKPTLITILYGVEVPSQGGNTLFCNTKRAYADLDIATKNCIETLFARHSYDHKFNQLRQMQGYKKNLMDDVIHPLVIQHPITSLPSLYLNQLCIRNIENINMNESDTLLTTLYTHVTQDKYIYSHRWQQGDILVWDNFSLMHRRENTPQASRILFRTSIHTSPPLPVKMTGAPFSSLPIGCK